MDFTTPGYHSPTYPHKTGNIPLVGNFPNPAEAQLNVTNVDTEVEPPKKEQYTFITETPLNALINMLRQRETFILSSLSRHGIYNVVKYLSANNKNVIAGLDLLQFSNVPDQIDKFDIETDALFQLRFVLSNTVIDDKKKDIYFASVDLFSKEINKYCSMGILIKLNIQ